MEKQGRWYFRLKKYFSILPQNFIGEKIGSETGHVPGVGQKCSPPNTLNSFSSENRLDNRINYK